MIFLGLNRKDLDATEAKVVQALTAITAITAITALAARSLTEVALAKWIRERLVRLKLYKVQLRAQYTGGSEPQRLDTSETESCRTALVLRLV